MGVAVRSGAGSGSVWRAAPSRHAYYTHQPTHARTRGTHARAVLNAARRCHKIQYTPHHHPHARAVLRHGAARPPPRLAKPALALQHLGRKLHQVHRALFAWVVRVHQVRAHARGLHSAPQVREGWRVGRPSRRRRAHKAGALQYAPHNASIEGRAVQLTHVFGHGHEAVGERLALHDHVCAAERARKHTHAHASALRPAGQRARGAHTLVFRVAALFQSIRRLPEQRPPAGVGYKLGQQAISTRARVLQEWQGAPAGRSQSASRAFLPSPAD